MANDGEKVAVDEARREIAGGDATAVDVRSEEEWGEGHVPGAIHLPDGDPEAGTKPLERGAPFSTWAMWMNFSGRPARRAQPCWCMTHDMSGETMYSAPA